MSRLLSICCALLLCSTLPACKPGEEKTKSVISQAVDATQSVQTEQITANMTAAAQVLLATPTATTVSQDLRTVICGTSPNQKAVSYIPNTARFIRGGRLPDDLSARLTQDLEKQFQGSNSVTTDGDALLTACGVTDVAMNSPVLMLDQNFAVASTDSTDESDIVSVDMGPCGGGQPGVIITKHKKDGTSETDPSGCGSAINVTTTTIALADTSGPDWKARLGARSAAPNILATSNFKCIASGSGCNPVTPAQLGEQVRCDNDPGTESMLVNPTYDTATAAFFHDPTPRNCGKGWTGELVARLKKKSCHVVKDGVVSPTETATVFDVAYVAAKCSKDNVKNVVTQCPAGINGTFFAEYDRVDMVEPVLLEPQTPVAGQPNNSLIALPGYNPGTPIINGINTLLGTSDAYVPTTNLRPVTDPKEFSTKIVSDMGDKAMPYNVTSCNTVGNSCAAAADHVVIVLDRSSSMGSRALTDQVSVSSDFADFHACKAGLKNLFKTADSAAACQAAKDFLIARPPGANADDLNLYNFIAAPWGGTVAPTGAAATHYGVMKAALIDEAKYAPALQLALSRGYDCRGRDESGVMKPFPLDLLGTCSGSASCDTCPGECVTDTAVQLPSSLEIKRIQAAELTLRQVAALKLNPGTKITVATFLNDAPQVITTEFCPASRRNAAGVCDVKLERDNLVNAFSTSDSTDANAQVFVKPVQQTVTIPTSPPPQPNIYIVPDQRTWSPTHREFPITCWTCDDDNGFAEFIAPTNTAITGRSHSGDEHGYTKYQYATLKAVDQNGRRLPGTIEIRNLQWSGTHRERDNFYFYFAGQNRVIVGRRHENDENGPTRYLTGEIFFNGVRTVGAIDYYYTGAIRESGWLRVKPKPSTFFPGEYVTDSRRFMTGRRHKGDENGDTWYEAATFYMPCNVAGLPPGMCPAACDTRQCLSLPADSGNWKDWKELEDEGTYNTPGAYQYGHCVVNACAVGNTACNNAFTLTNFPYGTITDAAQIHVFKKRLGDIVVEPAELTGSNDPNNTVYCEKRKAHLPWKSVNDAQTDGTYFNSASDQAANNATATTNGFETANYEFESCQVVNKCDHHMCDMYAMVWDPSDPDYNNKLACDANYNQCLMDYNDAMVLTPDYWMVKSNASTETYCGQRKQKPTVSDESFASCLDVCPPRTTTAVMQNCRTAKNLFTGVTSVQCENIDFPVALDYRPTGYTGGTVTKNLTRFIQVPQSDPNAIPVTDNGSVPIWGADYGGNTPLYETINKMLAAPDVVSDMAAQKNMAVIVMTDGVDTSPNGSPTAVKSLCNGDNPLVDALKAMNPNARPVVVSLDDDATAINDCMQSQGVSVVRASEFQTNTAVGTFARNMASNAVDYSSAAEASNFCNTFFRVGTVYTDTDVPPANVISTPGICRPYEIDP